MPGFHSFSVPPFRPGTASRTLAAVGYDLKDLPTTLKELQAERRRTHKKLIPAAAAHLMVQANLNIITRAAMDDDTIYGWFLALQRDMHQIMAGGSSGKCGNSVRGAPFPSSFVSEQPSPHANPAAPMHEWARSS